MNKERFTGDILFPAAMNFRDMGGYRAVNGKSVKHNIFYRSGRLSGLINEADRETFEKLQIKVILDFRSKGEADAAPDPVFKGVEYCHICALYEENGREMQFAPVDIEKLLMNPNMVSKQTDSMLEKMYGAMAFGNPGFQKMFREIENDNVPILFHCTAGKDRTGVAAMLILLALGVDEETVLEDYELTNLYRKDAIEAVIRKHAEQIAKVPEMKTMYSMMEGVDRKAAVFTLNKIKERYGHYNAYFEAEYGLTGEKLKKLRERYLE